MWRRVEWWLLVLTLPAWAWRVWSDGVYMPKNSAWTLWKATWRARRAELFRMTTTYQATWATALVCPPHGERLILAASVLLNEQRPTRRLFPSTYSLKSKRAWRPRDRTQAPVVITPVDRGTLALTNKRFIYESTRKHREYPIHDLTHVSTATGGVALAVRGHRGIAYYTGLDALRIHFCVAPGNEDRWKAQLIDSPLNGDDLEHMVRLLKHRAISALA